jgi:hypothetical protein
MDEETKSEIRRRSFAAWYRFYEGTEGGPVDSVEVVEVNDKYYAAVRHAGKLRAVFRVRNDLKLKRLFKWPKVIV